MFCKLIKNHSKRSFHSTTLSNTKIEKKIISSKKQGSRSGKKTKLRTKKNLPQKINSPDKQLVNLDKTNNEYDTVLDIVISFMACSLILVITVILAPYSIIFGVIVILLTR